MRKAGIWFHVVPRPRPQLLSFAGAAGHALQSNSCMRGISVGAMCQRVCGMRT